MVTFSQSDVIAHEERVARTKRKLSKDAAERETGKGGLHEQIMRHCDSQWPRWKYIHSRTDQKSTVAVGSHDFTVFLPGERTLCIECKAKGKKRDKDQMIWAYEMLIVGHKVHLVYSLDEFLELTK